ncbi:MAG TPA: RNA pseudouridine synthase [Cryomorphaceae bacterium]|nr:RNA pseudouridine synthase [Cryomorphaceae bacterium]|tara:strand:- start:3987 stop:4649 length:663 start_codon:yes stop_codon:yes gene_type:complete
MVKKDGVLFESNQLLVVEKPAGVITEDNPFEHNNLESNYREYLRQKINNPYIGVVHRLDRVTSGVVLFAKKRETLKTLNKWFEQRKIQKTYWAITNKVPREEKGVLTHYLLTDQKNKKALVTDTKVKGAKKAELSYRILSSSSKGHLLEIKPKTGRFHQIRAQLSQIGCPIIGDEKYKSEAEYQPLQIALHARSIELPSAINGSPLVFEAPSPNRDIWNS